MTQGRINDFYKQYEELVIKFETQEKLLKETNELVKSLNATIKSLNNTINENQKLEEKLRMNNIELNACYKIIKELLEKNKKIECIIKDKLGIEIINDKDNNINNLNK